MVADVQALLACPDQALLVVLSTPELKLMPQDELHLGISKTDMRWVYSAPWVTKRAAGGQFARVTPGSLTARWTTSLCHINSTIIEPSVAPISPAP